MNTFMSLGKYIAFLVLLLSISLTCYCQDISGKWKCSDEMFSSWKKAGYKKVKGTIRFKKNKTFTVKLYGNTKHRKYSNYKVLVVKLKGIYMIDNDTIYLSVLPKELKCNVQTSMEYPRSARNHERYDRYLSEKWDNKNSRGFDLLYDGWMRHYDADMTRNKFHEENVTDKLMPIFNKGYQFFLQEGKLLRMGNTFVLKR